MVLEEAIAFFVFALIVLFLWEAVWKIIAMWKSARQEQLAWFICIAIINTVGILPIVYLLFFQKNKKTRNQGTKKRRK